MITKCPDFDSLPRAASAGLVLFGAPLASPAQSVSEVQYRGWNVVRLANELLEVQVAPDIGGRIVSLRLGDFDFVFLNGDLAGRTSGPTGVGPQGEWLNYGGEKLWPAPQGRDGRPGHWNGPPDAVLDGSPHTATLLARKGRPEAVRLVSRDDPRSGIRLSREVRLYQGSTRVHVDATMTNTGPQPCRWGIWSVFQQNAANREGNGYDPNIRIYCPLRPNSVHREGYRVMHGPKDSSSFRVDSSRRMLVAQYQRRMGKVGIDSDAGWVATVHGSSGSVLVQRYVFRPEQEYPDHAAVEIWLHGPYGPKAAQTDAKTFPYFVETELLSPFAALQPGEAYTFSYDWYATSVGGSFAVADCNDVGVVCEPLAVTTRSNQRVATGRFGVFCQGVATLVAEDATGQPIGAPLLHLDVTPLQPVVLNHPLPVLPEQADSVAVLLADTAGNKLGRLALSVLSEANR